jgi:hypothetical protein
MIILHDTVNIQLFWKHKYDDDDEWKSQQLIKQYDDDVHNINWLSLPSNDL